MGLRIAILLAVVGALALIGGIAYFAVPNRRGPRVVVVAAITAILILASVLIFVAPIGAATSAPVDANLSLYVTGQTCESTPFTNRSACGSGPYALLNLRATNGVTRWSAPASVASGKSNNTYLGAPILRDGVVYTIRGGAAPGDAAATLFALRATDGGEVWRVTLEATPLDMEIADGQVFVLLKYHEDASLLRAFRASDGAPAQQFALPISAGFTIAGGLIIGCDSYLVVPGSASSSFAAYHLGDGSLAWRTATQVGTPEGAPAITCALAVANGVVYTAPYAGSTLTAVRVADGQPLWEAQIASVSTLQVSGDRLIVASQLNIFAAKFNPTDRQPEKVLG